MPEEPPPGWRHPHLWEPQGGFVRILDTEDVPATATAYANTPIDAVSHSSWTCGGARRRPPPADAFSNDDWDVFREIERYFCGREKRPTDDHPTDDDDDEVEHDPPVPVGTEERFHRSVAAIKAWRPSQPPSDNEKLHIYALFKQATSGRARGDPPPVFDPIGRAKFDAWKTLGRMGRGKAMLEYVTEAERQMARSPG